MCGSTGQSIGRDPSPTTHSLIIAPDAELGMIKDFTSAFTKMTRNLEEVSGKKLYFVHKQAAPFFSFWTH